jgi:hypothetical protein
MSDIPKGAWIGAEGGPCYPTERFKPKKGWHLEVLPLTYGRGRIVHTDGRLSIDEFW